MYDIVKTVYSTTAHETTEEGRIKVLQSTLGQLRLNNIATLDAVMTHFSRLLDLTSADETYKAALAHALAPCILRPRFESSLTMNERHSYRLVRDLFAHREAIFGELKRQSSATHGLATSGRPRTISTDESNRRAATEARQRAIVNRARDKSPATARRHARDRSSGPENGRFPINVGSPSAGGRRTSVRNSREVRSRGNSQSQHQHQRQSQSQSASTSTSGSTSATSTSTATPATPERGPTSGSGNIDDNEAPTPDDSIGTGTTSSTSSPTPARELEPESDIISSPITKSPSSEQHRLPQQRRSRESISSLSRSTVRPPRRMSVSTSGSPTTTSSLGHRFSASTSSPIASLANAPEMKGVTLEDKPMDDD